MALTIIGNINGPEGVFKTYADIAQGGTFVFSVQDVGNNVFFLKSTAGAVSPDGAVQSVDGSQGVVEVQVSAVVTV